MNVVRPAAIRITSCSSGAGNACASESTQAPLHAALLVSTVCNQTNPAFVVNATHLAAALRSTHWGVRQHLLAAPIAFRYFAIEHLAARVALHFPKDRYTREY